MFSHRLKQLRQDLGLTQDELAKEKELEQARQEAQPSAPEEIQAEAEDAPAFTMRM